MHEGFGGLKRVIDELEAWLAAKRLCFADLIGGASDALQSYAAQSERPGRWQGFVPPGAMERG